MFHLDQIKEIQSSVRSGADFPHYVQAMKKIGVTSYQWYVADGHARYNGADGFLLSGEAAWPEKAISAPASAERLAHDLKIHQLGKSDFLTFCQQAADAGVARWTVDMEHLKCTYFDADGTVILEEDIPLPA